MKVIYLLPSIVLLSFSNVSRSQEINFTNVNDISSVPAYKDAKMLAEINSEGADAYPWISPDGLTLYFSQGSSVSESNLYVARRATLNDMFADVSQVGQRIPEGSFSCWLSNDEKDIYYINSRKLYHSSRISRTAAFGEPKEVVLPGVSGFISGPSLSPDGKQLFIYNHGSDAKKILHFINEEDGNFVSAGELEFPLGYEPNPGQLSKDGLKYYVTLGNSDSEKLYMLSRKSLNESFDNALSVPSVNNSGSVDQPSVSADGSVVVFVKSTGTWTENELCVTTNDNARSMLIAKKYGTALDVHPNPFISTATVTFTIEKADHVKIAVYTLSGYEIAVLNDSYISEGEHVLTLDRMGLKPGTYIAKLQSGDKVQTQRMVITD
jgi:Tol biopolymer transport system component